MFPDLPGMFQKLRLFLLLIQVVFVEKTPYRSGIFSPGPIFPSFPGCSVKVLIFFKGFFLFLEKVFKTIFDTIDIKILDGSP
jgi:hypothetical protein